MSTIKVDGFDCWFLLGDGWDPWVSIGRVSTGKFVCINHNWASFHIQFLYINLLLTSQPVLL